MFKHDDEQTHKDRMGSYSPHHNKSYGTGTYQKIDSETSLTSDHAHFDTASVMSTGGKNKKKLGLLALVVLIYYEVSGGPFGIEDIVRAGGPLYAILGFGLFFVWVIPEALVTAELSTALPEASGAVGKKLALCCTECCLY